MAQADRPADTGVGDGGGSNVNPMGTDGFEFVEYAAPDPKALAALFERMGFRTAART